MGEYLFAVGSGWSIWRQVFLRGAGFPIGKVLELQSPAASAAADTLLDQELLREALAAAAEHDLRAGKHIPEVEKLCRKALRRLKKEQPLNAPELIQERFPSVRNFVNWNTSYDALREGFAAKYAEDEVALAEVLATIAGDTLFQEAILWQNASAAKIALPRLREPGRKLGAKQRMRWRLVANYLQRYCTKNDTIGFFGPVGWATVVPGLASIHFEAGQNLLARRRVYFEFWGIDTLARKFSLDDNLWPSIVPRRNPTGYLEGQSYHGADGEVSELPEEFCVALRACDSRRTIQEIAQQLCDTGATESEDEGFELLLTLAESELIYARFEMPSVSRFPADALRSLLERAPEVHGAIALAELDELESKRQHVEAAGGNPEALSDALEDLNRCFERLTDASSVRDAGQTYAGRTLVYEDCIRDVELEFGEELVRRISNPILLVLQSARWFCWEIGQRYKAELRNVFDSLCAENDKSELTLMQFLHGFLPLFPGPEKGGGIVEEVRAQLQQKWKSVLCVDASAKRVNIDVASIEDDVNVTFAAPGPGWPSARHHSPDILLAAKSIEAIENLDFKTVLGEIHVGASTVGSPDNVIEHLNPELLIEAREADLPLGIAPTWNFPIRVMHYSISDKDYDLESGVGLSHRPREHVLSIGSCTVFLKDDEIYVRSQDGGPEFHILAFAEQHLIAETLSEFKMLSKDDAHGPRVTLGDLVLQRETWRVDASDVPAAQQPDRIQAFLEVRRWAREMDFPRFIFVKTQAETKPFFVDLDSLVLVSNFLRHAQAPGRISISEMLPDFDHAWLEDKEGQRYCSELRLCYVDPIAWQP